MRTFKNFQIIPFKSAHEWGDMLLLGGWSPTVRKVSCETYR